MWYRWSREETLELLNRISDIQELLEKQLGYDGEAEERKKRGPTWETHDWPVKSCNASCMACPPPPPCCCLVVGLGVGPFLLLVVVD